MTASDTSNIQNTNPDIPNFDLQNIDLFELDQYHDDMLIQALEKTMTVPKTQTQQTNQHQQQNWHLLQIFSKILSGHPIFQVCHKCTSLTQMSQFNII